MGTPEAVGLPVPGLSEGSKCLYQEDQQYKKISDHDYEGITIFQNVRSFSKKLQESYSRRPEFCLRNQPMTLTIS